MHVGITLFVVALAAPGADVIRGVVHGPDGHAVERADVWLVNRFSTGFLPADGKPDAHVVSGADGRFAIPVPVEAPFGKNHGVSLFAVKSGAGMATMHLDGRFLPTATQQLVLQPCVPRTLQICDPAGKPLRDATVRLHEVTTNAAGGGGFVLPAMGLGPFAGTAGGDGKITFELPQPLNYFILIVQAPGLGLQFVTGSGDAVDQPLRLKPVGKLRGRLTGDDSNATAGALVRIMTIPQPPDRSPISVLGVTEVRTDDAGRFEVPEIVAGEVRVFWIDHAPDSSIFLKKERISLLPAGESRDIEVPVIRGARVFGRVVEDATSRPLSDIRVHVFLNQNQGGVTSCWSVSTDKQGRYEAHVPPAGGRGFVRFGPLPAPYIPATPDAALQAEFPKDGEELEMPDILLRPGTMLKGRVVDARQQAVALAHVQIATVDPVRAVYHRAVAETDVDGSFSIGPVDEKLVLALMATDDTRASAAALIIQPEQPRKNIVLPIDGQAMVLLSGRLVDSDGKPIPNALVHAGSEMPLENWIFEAMKGLLPTAPLEMVSDKDGRFTFPARVPILGRYYLSSGQHGFVTKRIALEPFEFPAGKQTLKDLVLERVPSAK